MRLLPGMIYKELCVETLTHQPSLHIYLAGQYRINMAGDDFLSEMFEREHSDYVFWFCIGKNHPGVDTPEWSILAVTIRTTSFLHVGVIFLENINHLCLGSRFTGNFIPELDRSIFNSSPFFIRDGRQLHLAAIDA